MFKAFLWVGLGTLAGFVTVKGIYAVATTYTITPSEAAK